MVKWERHREIFVWDTDWRDPPEYTYSRTMERAEDFYAGGADERYISGESPRRVAYLSGEQKRMDRRAAPETYEI